MYRVVIASAAEDDIQRNFDWWKEHRSLKEASRWFWQVYEDIESLGYMPLRCPRARESEKLDLDIREHLFGTSRITHRILFTVENKTVHVARVVSTSQDDITVL